MNNSILYKQGADYTSFDEETVWKDIRIDQIIKEIMDIRKIPSIYGYFLQKPSRLEDVQFRLEIVRELENENLYCLFNHFLSQYKRYKLYLGYSSKLAQLQTKEKWLLDAACVYCTALVELNEGLASIKLQSDGLRRLNACLIDYITGEVFVGLKSDAFTCADMISKVRYAIDVDLENNMVGVSRDCGGQDYFDDIAEIFGRFHCEALEKEIIALPGINLGSLELRILEALSQIYPHEFKALEQFTRRHASFEHSMTDRFESELQFYLSYIDYIRILKGRGLEFSYPGFTQQNSIKIIGGYDLSLISDKAGSNEISSNDFILEQGRSVIITGPNQCGKTSYARMVGQMVYFASLGLLVPCKSYKADFIKDIYTLFAREENISANLGRLKEELVRIKLITDSMPPRSLIIFNEVFNSTTPHDAVQITGEILKKLGNVGGFCVFATHINEIAALPHTRAVHMHVDFEEGTKRYRAQSNGLDSGKAFSSELLDKYHLYYTDIKERVV